MKDEDGRMSGFYRLRFIQGLEDLFARFGVELVSIEAKEKGPPQGSTGDHRILYQQGGSNEGLSCRVH